MLNNPNVVVFNIPATNLSHTADSIVSIFYQNAGTQSLASGLAVFGQVFAPGEVPSGARLSASIGDTPIAIQADIKTIHADGSANMVVLTAARPAIAAGASARVDLALGGPAPAASLDLKTGLGSHDFQVTIAGPGLTTQRIDVLDMLETALRSDRPGAADFWQNGPLASQARLSIDLEGASRMVFDVTLFRGGGLSVEAQFNNDGAMEAVGGRIARQLTFTLDGVTAPTVQLNQGQYQNWHGSFSNTERDGGQGLGDASAGWLNIRQDVAHLHEAGAVASYDLTVGVNATLLDGWAAAARAPGWDAPMAAHGVVTFMPGTGGRADIGFTTAANTAWLMSQDARAAQYALGQAEAASVAPWHMWDALNDTWLGTDAYPRLWTDVRGGTGQPGQATSTGLTQQTDGGTGWTLDASHQPSLSYVPYLMTGSRWMLDNIQAQASWSLMSHWPDVRGGALDLVVRDNQVRGAAWSLRQIDEAAWASPAGSEEKAAFTEASNANWAWLVSRIPEWTALQGEAYGRLPGHYGVPGALPPWQQDYFASTSIAAARRGNPDALTFLEWQSNFLVGRFTHDSQGFATHDGAAYLIAISDPVTGAPHKTWAAIGAQTVARGWSNGDGWSQSQGDYAQLALATLAGIADLTGSNEAAKAYRNLLANAPPFTGPSDYARDPTYSLTPPELPELDVPPPGASPPALPGTAAVSIVLSGESWNGDPDAVILLDGREVFHGTIAATRASGGVLIELGQVTLTEAHAVTVRFVNDAWGGTPELDRNLRVDDLRIDRVSTGQQADLFSNGEVVLRLPGEVQPPVATPTPTPTPTPIPAPVPPTGAGVPIRLGLSEDAWAGHAQATILLDGIVLVQGVIVTASHAAGATQYLDLLATISPGPHTLTVRFINDAWGGNASADRNLHVDSLIIDGVDMRQSAALLWNRDVDFTYTQAVTQITGTGRDELRIGVSADSWNGNPHFLVLVDGQQIGAVRSTAVEHASGGVDMHNLRGDFGAGPHVVTVRFLDDAWGGSVGRDRNLYVDSVVLNGSTVQHSAVLFANGDAVFAF